MQNQHSKFLRKRQSNLYYFFRANQQKADTKIYSSTLCIFTVNECDWHILAGNDNRIKSHCLTFINKYCRDPGCWIILYNIVNDILPDLLIRCGRNRGGFDSSRKSSNVRKRFYPHHDDSRTTSHNGEHF